MIYPQQNLLVDYGYNKANLITMLRNKRENGPIISQWEYDYLLDGNLHTKKDQDGTKTYFGYDYAGRLIKEYQANFEVDYEYDRFSNRSKMIANNNEASEAAVTNYYYNKNNWLLLEEKIVGSTISKIHYNYDRNGNQTSSKFELAKPIIKKLPGIAGFKQSSGNGNPYIEICHYDGLDRLIAIQRDLKRVSYQYRPDGLRHGKTVQEANGKPVSTVHGWDGIHMVAETLDGVIISYLRGRQLIARRAGNHSLEYYLHNEHGDVVFLSGTNGQDTEYAYDAFGIEDNPNESDKNPFRYSGEYYDQDAGSIYLRTRRYQPKSGRFTSSDPERDGLNWYSYCKNNPIQFIDPLGTTYIVQDRSDSPGVIGGVEVIGDLLDTYSLYPESKTEHIISTALESTSVVSSNKSYLAANAGKIASEFVVRPGMNGMIVGGSSMPDLHISDQRFDMFYHYSGNLMDWFVENGDKTVEQYDGFKLTCDGFKIGFLVSDIVGVFSSANKKYKSWESDNVLFFLLDLYGYEYRNLDKASMEHLLSEIKIIDSIIDQHQDYFFGSKREQFRMDYNAYYNGSDKPRPANMTMIVNDPHSTTQKELEEFLENTRGTKARLNEIKSWHDSDFK